MTNALLFGGSRVAAQGLAFVSGIVVVRYLPPHDYALYSIAAAFVSALTVLTATGVTSRYLSLSATASGSPSHEPAIFHAALQTRFRLTAIVLLLGLPLLAALLLANGGSFWTVSCLLVAVAICVVAVQRTGLITARLQVEKRVVPIGMLDLLSNLFRTTAVGIAAAFSLLAAPAAMLMMAASSILQNIVGARLLRFRNPGSNSAPKELRASFRLALRQSLPAALTMVVSEQLVVLFLTLAGNTEGIAQVSALTRYAAIFAIVNNVLGTWGASSIAGVGGNGRSLVVAAGRYVVLYALCCSIFAIVVWTFSYQLLQLLGPSYNGLVAEFRVLMAGVLITNFASFGLGTITHSRGFLSFSWTYVPLVAVWLGVSLWLLDLSSSLHVALFAASLSLPLLACQLVRLGSGLWIGRAGDGKSQ